MLSKKKICAGYNGVEHEDYIYKNINGRKYCKSCAFRLQPPKAIPKRTEKQKIKMSLKKDLLVEDQKFYTDIWTKRFFEHVPHRYFYKKVSQPICEVCGDPLPDEPNLMNFHHILEKRNYPHLRHDERNIAILCPECHNLYETFPDKVPYLVDKRAMLLEEENYKID